MIVVLNPNAGAGSALRRWRTIEQEFGRVYGRHVVRACATPELVWSAVEAAATSNDPRLIAAGGDGTVNAVTQAAMHLPQHLRGRLMVGAVGIGSSNDFHKPASGRELPGGIHVRACFREAVLSDIGKIETRSGEERTVRYFVVNASAGITADGNARFNAPGPFLRALKRTHTPSAIVCAALVSILRFRNMPMILSGPGLEPAPVVLTTLNILKSPFISGQLRLNIPAGAADGQLSVLLAENLSIAGRLGLLRALTKGNVSGLARVRVWVTPELTVSAASPYLVEYDGEVRRVTDATFSIVPRAMRICP